MFLTRIGYGIIYFVVLVYEIIKSTISVAFGGVLGRNIDPVVVDIETVLERPVSQTILANSISLTPGTLSVDLDSENNIIKVAAISPRKKEDIIPFEPYIKKMLEWTFFLKRIEWGSMDILFISKYIVVIALIIMMLAALRASAYKSTSMGLLGSSVVVVAFAVALLIVGDLYHIEFSRDISLALIFFGFVGTIAFASVLGGGDEW